MNASDKSELFESAAWYDRSINWAARMEREVPVLTEVLGAPGSQNLLDAGCGSGRHVEALHDREYSMTGLDCSAAMLDLARQRLARFDPPPRLLEMRFEALSPETGPFDGVYCLGNSLAAAASADSVQQSLQGFASVLRPGGRLFLQLLNFAKLFDESPRVRGPRVCTFEDVTYISTRVYAFVGEQVEVTNVTLWYDDTWRQFARTGHLYPVGRDWLMQRLDDCGLEPLHCWGGYDRSPYDPVTSNDLIVVANRVGG